jgi:hypothetical protein
VDPIAIRLWEEESENLNEIANCTLDPYLATYVLGCSSFSALKSCINRLNAFL